MRLSRNTFVTPGRKATSGQMKDLPVPVPCLYWLTSRSLPGRGKEEGRHTTACSEHPRFGFIPEPGIRAKCLTACERFLSCCFVQCLLDLIYFEGILQPQPPVARSSLPERQGWTMPGDDCCDCLVKQWMIHPHGGLQSQDARPSTHFILESSSRSVYQPAAT